MSSTVEKFESNLPDTDVQNPTTTLVLARAGIMVEAGLLKDSHVVHALDRVIGTAEGVGDLLPGAQIVDDLLGAIVVHGHGHVIVITVVGLLRQSHLVVKSAIRIALEAEEAAVADGGITIIQTLVQTGKTRERDMLQLLVSDAVCLICVMAVVPGSRCFSTGAVTVLRFGSCTGSWFQSTSQLQLYSSFLCPNASFMFLYPLACRASSEGRFLFFQQMWSFAHTFLSSLTRSELITRLSCCSGKTKLHYYLILF
eukprot:m.14165 g.14165  ORF g.14165 m.14165 type:complete len:255 (+) comp25582_c0_seq1:294-1058(+)